MPRPGDTEAPIVNPTLIALECVYPVAAFINQWRQAKASKRPAIPSPAEGMVLVYRDPQSELVRAIQANDELLLAIKVVHEKANIDETAEQVGINPEQLNQFLAAAADKGVICA